ncbi:MAG TPA: radical SAM family heme chaperone HemW [Bacteroidia bacterium]|jgi:oxygen-independent coproporphyrinogen-3 oxidase|nr:radical SAM family heme chaperone HemW [Bacteroidia bacterium]
MQGIYLHIPFCRKACTYCDFHFSTLLKTKTDLVDALCKEIELQKDFLKEKKINSIYFGGGTPSVLDKNELEKIFAALHKNFTWDKDAEITFECNPDDLTKEKLLELKEFGVNRLSIGLQSFDDAELKWMNRLHTAQQSIDVVKLAQDLDFKNISIDLIYGSKFQTIDSWKKTLEKALSLGVQHISSYNLTIESKTALGNAVKEGKEKIVDEEKSAEQFIVLMDVLHNNGFEHYEISNFALKGFEAVHNTNYWKGAQYLGIGPSAHSFNGVSRQWNISNNPIYIDALKHNTGFFETETLSKLNRYNEYILTRLRTKWGCDLNYIKSEFGNSFAEHFEETSAQFLLKDLQQSDSNYSLTKMGKLMADKIAMELFM